MSFMKFKSFIKYEIYFFIRLKKYVNKRGAFPSCTDYSTFPDQYLITSFVHLSGECVIVLTIG